MEWTPETSFADAAWISDRHFLLPIDDGNGAWLCDLSPLEPGDPVFDVVPSQSEILGFWEDPEILGYEDFLESMTIHTVVSVPQPGSYNLTGVLSGFRPSQYAAGADVIQAGTRSIARRWTDADFAGPFTFQNVRLLRDFAGDVLAFASDLRSTETYRTTSEEVGLKKWQEQHANPNPAPAIVGVNPSRGMGPDQWFRISGKSLSNTYEALDLLFNDRPDENGGCSISYRYSQGGSMERTRISVRGDGRAEVVSEEQFQTGLWRGHENALEAAPVENSRCGLSGIEHGVGELGMRVTFKPVFFGEKNVYARVSTAQGVSSGWKQIGTWLANPEQAPMPISVIPYLGSGIRQTFTFIASDVNGASDIAAARILIQSDRQKQNACAFTFSLPSNTISLVGDDGKPAAILQNAQCKISEPSVVAESRDSMQFQMNIEFSGSFAGRRNIYAEVEDKEHESSSWQWLGSWHVSRQ